MCKGAGLRAKGTEQIAKGKGQKAQNFLIKVKTETKETIAVSFN